MKNSRFYEQAKLMLQLLPSVAKHSDVFALKGGTAINLFVRDMPRLSVDIDLAYLPLKARHDSLQEIDGALKSMSASIKRSFPGSVVHEKTVGGPHRLNKLIVVNNGVLVKIEPNEVLRGSVYPPQEKALSPMAEQAFEMAVTINTLSFADLYGGKICAALDRQHPRDLFDVKLLMESEGIMDAVKKAFVIYLASHSRPMAELLNPNQIDFRSIYENEFEGMTAIPVSHDELVETRKQLVQWLNTQLTDRERQFLLSIKMGEPAWDLLGIEGIEKLPAIQWKLLNIKKMDPKKHQNSIDKLRAVLKI